MYMRIYWGRIESGTWPAVERAYRDLAAVPIPGMKARWLTQDTADPDSLYTVTLWDSAAAVEAWEGSDEYRDVFMARLRPFLVGSQAVSLCEVKIAIGGPPAAAS